MIKLDILIKNGHVIDPKQGINGIKTIGILGKHVVQVDNESCESNYIVDASGCYIFPGLVDFHTHLYYGGSEFGLKPDYMLPHGVTSAVDAGTSGYCNFDAFNRAVVSSSTVKIRSFISVCATGLCDLLIRQNYDPKLFNERRIRETKDKYGDELLGLKIVLSKEIIGEHGLDSLKATVELAEKIGGLAVCVHTTDPPCATTEIADVLRPDDIFCHCYHGNGATIVDKNGKVYEGIKRARNRGVIFDAANGIGHFNHNVCRLAINDNFLPDIISSDAVSFGYNRSRRNKTLSYVMSKYLSLGIDISTIVKAVTETPAYLMKMEGKIGTLASGAFADVAIFKLTDQNILFEDDQSKLYEGDKFLIPQMTISNGQIVYSQTDFNNN